MLVFKLPPVFCHTNNSTKSPAFKKKSAVTAGTAEVVDNADENAISVPSTPVPFTAHRLKRWPVAEPAQPHVPLTRYQPAVTTVIREVLVTVLCTASLSRTSVSQVSAVNVVLAMACATP